MAPSPPRLRILSVGGNAVSAFLSWRLQATNACDVTLVWKQNHAAVAQYGISFRSIRFGNERFRPRHVVQSPQDASAREAAFDYVLLCVKALPDVYDLADIIETVVTPQHTCILVNTTNTIGVEQRLEERFPTNVVLSLVSGAELKQVGPSEFEHVGVTEVWVGPANLNSAIPGAIQKDMSEALAMTLQTGQVDCHVSPNIRQQQYERMIGPIAFHPAGVLFGTTSNTELIQKTGVREMINDIIDELLKIAAIHDCTFPPDFKQTTVQAMLASDSEPSTMYQDFTARRPMEVETYLGAPLNLANAAGIKVPRLATLYALLHHTNVTLRFGPHPTSPSVAQPPPRIGSAPPQQRPMNGFGRGGRPPAGPGMPVPPGGRRGPPPVNGFRGGMNGFPPRGPSQLSRRPSDEENNLDEFSHVVLYDDIPEGDVATAYEDSPQGAASPVDLKMREREFMLRQREMQLREQAMALQRGRGGRRVSHNNRRKDFDDDDDDGDDYVDPADHRGPPPPQIDPENFDMLSVTSRRTKRAPSASQLRKNVFEGSNSMRPGAYGRPFPMGRNRTSTRMMADIPGLTDNIMDNPMIGFSSNRYGNVDRKELHDESRANSLTAGRLQEMGHIGGPYPPPISRRTSQSPGNPLGPAGRGMGRPSPPNDGYLPPGGMPNGNRRSPPSMRAPIARYPPGQGNQVHPGQVELQVGVSKPFPPPKNTPKSLTGSASASAGSGDSGSANIDSSEPSAHSSASSLAPRYPMGVR